MKFAAVTLSLLPVIFALTTSYDTAYDNKGQSLATVACSDGSNGLLTKNYTTFGSLPSFPFIGGAPPIAGWNSASCGTCWNLTYTAQNVSKTITVLGIDVATPDSFNIAKAALDALTGNQAQQLGRVPVTAVQVNTTFCGLK
ncbi:snodprot1 [Crepidotus variabilis]|uniref:Snodprot1 n=1 Tax=Crepidotus variabilis TaxID=179855 RepID=A0A9P6EPI4_9AGAR|nr:snodprot1 [Crepidotus variabilis]